MAKYNCTSVHFIIISFQLLMYLLFAVINTSSFLNAIKLINIFYYPVSVMDVNILNDSFKKK